MRIRLAVLLGAVCIVVLILSITVAPGLGQAPPGSCPDGFSEFFFVDHDPIDRNGDGILCLKPVPPESTLFLIIDNNSQVP